MDEIRQFQEAVGRPFSEFVIANWWLVALLAVVGAVWWFGDGFFRRTRTEAGVTVGGDADDGDGGGDGGGD